jgi:SAM-dependent methyltransferase
VSGGFISDEDKVAGEELKSANTAADFLATWLNHRLLSTESQKLVDDYYRNFRGMHSLRMRYWYNSQVAEAEAIVRQIPGLRVLEIGVGTGTEFLWWGMRGAKVTGIDAFPHCVAATKERLEVLQRLTGRTLDCSVKLIPITKFQDPDGFDLIWMEQAFHHLEPRAAVVEQIASLLRPGGRVVLSEANALNPLLQLQLFRSRGFKMTIDVETEQGVVIYGNERILWRGALARWFYRVGIEQESVRYYRVFPSNAVFEPLFGLERHISNQWLAPLYTHYNFVGRKKTPL